MATTLINPPELAPPRGFSHGAMGTGRLLFIAGQTGQDQNGKIVSDDLVAQFDRALAGVARLLSAANGTPQDLVKITLLVVSQREYRDRSAEIGAAYRKHLGRHFPPMTLAEVSGLWDGAKVEIEAVAMVP